MKGKSMAKFFSMLSWPLVLSRLLAAFFLLGSAINIIAPGSTAADYQRWGYPAWFHFVTGAMELAACVLLIAAPARLFGAALGSAVMLGAITTLLVHGEYAHAGLPAGILALLMLVGWVALLAWATVPA
jgi:hypothetical protein